MVRPTVAILEDDPDTLFLYELLLKDAGYDVLTAPTASDLASHLRTTAPRAIVMDLALPDGRGVTICKALRHLPRFALTPVIAVTGWVGGYYVRGLEDAQFNEVLHKPVDPAELLAAVARWAPVP